MTAHAASADPRRSQHLGLASATAYAAARESSAGVQPAQIEATGTAEFEFTGPTAGLRRSGRMSAAIRIDVVGAAGGPRGTSGAPGAGAQAIASFGVTPGEIAASPCRRPGAAKPWVDSGGRRLERWRRRRRRRSTGGGRPAPAAAAQPTSGERATASSTGSSSVEGDRAAPAAGSAARSARAAVTEAV